MCGEEKPPKTGFCKGGGEKVRVVSIGKVADLAGARGLVACEEAMVVAYITVGLSRQWGGGGRWVHCRVGVGNDSSIHRCSLGQMNKTHHLHRNPSFILAED